MISEKEILKILNERWADGVVKAEKNLLNQKIKIENLSDAKLEKYLFNIWTETVANMLKHTPDISPVQNNIVAKNFLRSSRETKIKTTKDKDWSLQNFIEDLKDLNKILKEKGEI